MFSNLSLLAEEDLFHHVRDFSYFELPYYGKLHLPDIAGFQITKFMVLQLVAFVLTLLIFRGLASRAKSGEPVNGGFWNFWETIALFLRDEVVRPTIGDAHVHDDHDHDDGGHHGDGHHESHKHEVAVDPNAKYEGVVGGKVHHDALNGEDFILEQTVPTAVGHRADKYLPFVWSCFFYILFCNLLGAIPYLGSATGEINVTAALALVAFAATVIFGIQEVGGDGFVKSFFPDIGVEGPMGFMILCLLGPIEIIGLFIKHGVLAVRLFANIMGGHTVLGVMLGFIALVGVYDTGLFYLVTPASIAGQVGIGLLELFVAFLQAYVFAFLATIFISAAVNPH